jgi:tetratricopeptide (TPR) repeat protein
MRPLTSSSDTRALLIALSLYPFGVCAQEPPTLIEQIQSIARSQGYAPALRELDEEIAVNGHIKTELLVLKAGLKINNQETQEAIAIYQKLIKEQPKNLVLRNNLAGIYASQGKLTEAERLMLAGIKQHPDFSLLYNNLQTLKSQQAAMSLQLALDPSKPRNPRAQLSPIHLMNGLDVKAPKFDASIAQISPARKTENPVEPAKPPAPTPVQPAAQAVSKVEPLAQIASVEEQQVLSFAQDWTAAWSSGDAERYLSFYSKEFVPETNASFNAWAVQRRQRISPEQGIQVRIEEVQVVSLTNQSAEVKFRQFYQSKTLQARSGKVLTLSRPNGEWKIIRERVLPR